VIVFMLLVELSSCQRHLARWLITPQLMPGVSQLYDPVECRKN